MKVLFVGSNPSAKNVDAAIPFQGTQSWRVLKGWIAELELAPYEYELLNLSDKVLAKNQALKISDWNLARLNDAIGPRTLPIALGRNAEKALQKCGKIYLTLPHPSPRNRILNDKNRLHAILLAAKWHIALWETSYEMP